MLFSAANIRLVAGVMQAIVEEDRPWLVVDPVMVATSGDRLIENDAVAAYRESLFPFADLLTPNLDEAATVLGRAITTEAAMREAARELSEGLGASVLLKGGHLGGDSALDILHPCGGKAEAFQAPFVRDVSTHGTGCTLSAAITAGLASGLAMPDAIHAAKAFVTGAIATICRWGTIDALNHSDLK